MRSMVSWQNTQSIHNQWHMRYPRMEVARENACSSMLSKVRRIWNGFWITESSRNGSHRRPTYMGTGSTLPRRCGSEARCIGAPELPPPRMTTAGDPRNSHFPPVHSLTTARQPTNKPQ